MRPSSPRIGALVLASSLWAAAAAAGEADPAAHRGHLVRAADTLTWVDTPPGLPPGGRVALLAGDPGSAGAYTLRAWFPDGYRVPPHWHPSTEHLTVLSGRMVAGAGESMERGGEAVGPGGFVVMPAEMVHWVRMEGDTVLQVHGTGPFQITYVDPADDPRGTGAAREATPQTQEGTPAARH